MSNQTTFLVRFGVLTLKSTPVRRKMVQRLVENIRLACKLHACQAKFEQTWSRLFVHTEHPQQVSHILSHTFGIRSFSKIHSYTYTNQEDLIEHAWQHFAKMVENQRFAVRAKREKKNPLSTRELERKIGKKLVDAGGIVDLTTPALTCSIELRAQKAYLYGDVQMSPGGLPLGTEGRALCLISGGFDSPVAAWHIMRRGVPCDYLYFELGGMAQRGTIYAHLQHLYREWSFGITPKLFVVPGTPVIQALQQSIPEKYWNVMLKRIFYRVAEALVSKRKYVAMVTGEVIAQVSSQTLRNLQAIEADITGPILRPLITMEKQDIIAKSREIGTHDMSATTQEYCAITPRKPATRSKSIKILEFESQLGGLPFYQTLLEQVEVVEIAGLAPAQVQYLEAIIDYIPSKATWLDLREPPIPPLSKPHKQYTLEQLITNPSQLPKEETYLLLCEVGMQSAEAAYMLRELGYQAYAYQGGTKRLQKQLDK